VNPGNHIVYHYTVKNLGDAAAHDVHLTREFGSGAINPDSTDGDGGWNLGTLAPGDVREISELTTINQNVASGGQQSVSDTAQVTEDEADAHPEDNSDVIGMVVGYPTYVGGGSGIPGPLPHFTITKTSNATTTLAASSTVDYVVHLVNDGGFANHAAVNDWVTDPSGAVIHGESWDLGNVKPQEDITLTYTMFFSASSTSGIYTNSAQVVAVDNQFDKSAVASTTITIAGAVTPVGPGFTPSAPSKGDASVAAASSQSLARFMTDATSTVRRPLDLKFLATGAPLPPDAG